MMAVVVSPGSSANELTFRQLPVPVAGPGQVGVAVRAIGVNFRDVHTRLEPLVDVGSIVTPGTDFAGVIDDVGDGVGDLKIGDRVLAPSWLARTRSTFSPLPTCSLCCPRVLVSNRVRLCP